MVENIIECEMAYINTQHPDFIGGSDALISAHYSVTAEQRHPEEFPPMEQPALPVSSPPQQSGLLGRIFGNKSGVEEEEKKQENRPSTTITTTV